MTIAFDMRITPTDSKDKLKEMIMGWVEEAGPDCTVEWVQDNDVAPVTDTNPATNPWWRVFESVLKDMYVHSSCTCIYTHSCTLLPILYWGINTTVAYMKLHEG